MMLHANFANTSSHSALLFCLDSSPSPENQTLISGRVKGSGGAPLGSMRGEGVGTPVKVMVTDKEMGVQSEHDE